MWESCKCETLVLDAAQYLKGQQNQYGLKGQQSQHGLGQQNTQGFKGQHSQHAGFYRKKRGRL